MDSDELNHIKSNLPELITQTNCTEVVLAKLQRDGILSCNETESLRVNQDKFRRATMLYDLVQTRHRAFPTLTKILHEESQSGAAAILGRKLGTTAFDRCVDEPRCFSKNGTECGLMATQPSERVNANSPETISIPLVSVAVSATLVHCVAQVGITQEYCNYGENPIETVYYFPVCPDGAVAKFEAKLEGRKLKSKVVSKDEARRVYQSAVQNQTSACIGQECRADVFKVVVGFLKPGVTVKIYIEYVTEVKNEPGTNTIRFSIPTTIAPRYVAPDENGDKADSFRSMEFSQNSPAPLKINVNVMIQGGIKLVESPSHGIVVNYETEGNLKVPLKADVKLEAKTTAMDRDFVLSIVPNEGHQPKLYSETIEGGSTAVLVHLVPSFKLEVQKSELIFLLDRSGSMAGHKMELATKSLLVFLHSMPADCFFNIIGFGSSYEFLFPTSVQYDDDNLQRAIRHAQWMEADLAGTDIFSPLQEIYRKPLIPGYLRQIFLITDGEVTNIDAVIGITTANAHNARVFSLGIGQGASRHLVEDVAKAGGGMSAFVQGDENFDLNILSQLKRALKPSLTEVQVNWDGYNKEQDNNPIPVNEEMTLFGYNKPKLEAQSGTLKKFQQAPQRIPPIFDGCQMVVIGLFQSEPPKFVNITAQSPVGPLSIRLENSKVHLNTHEVLHRLAVTKLVREMEVRISSLSLESNGNVLAKHGLLRSEVIELACRHGISSKYTSFLVVDDEDKVCQQGSSMKPMVSMRIPIQLPSSVALPTSAASGGQFTNISGYSSEVAVAENMMEECCFVPLNLWKKSAPKFQNNLHSPTKSKVSDKTSKNENENLTRQLIQLQSFRGSFVLNEDLSQILGRSLASLLEVARKEGLLDTFFATALAVAFFSRRLPNQKGIWELVVKKARDFLKEKVTTKSVDEVIQIADAELQMNETREVQTN